MHCGAECKLKLTDKYRSHCGPPEYLLQVQCPSGRASFSVPGLPLTSLLIVACCWPFPLLTLEEFLHLCLTSDHSYTFPFSNRHRKLSFSNTMAGNVRWHSLTACLNFLPITSGLCKNKPPLLCLLSL